MALAAYKPLVTKEQFKCTEDQYSIYSLDLEM